MSCHEIDADYKTLRFEAGDLDLSLSLLLSSLFISLLSSHIQETYSCFLLLSLSPLLSRSLLSLSPRSERSLSLLSPRSRASYLLLLLLFISSSPIQQRSPNSPLTISDGGPDGSPLIFIFMPMPPLLPFNFNILHQFPSFPLYFIPMSNNRHFIRRRNLRMNRSLRRGHFGGRSRGGGRGCCASWAVVVWT
jgi:hypothetical protein